MTNVKSFRHADYNREQDQQVFDPEDREKLRGLLGQAIEALSARHPNKPKDQEVRIRNFRSDRYDLVDDLIVIIEERDDGEYVATSFDTGRYGHGYSPDGAIQHLCSVLEDYYELLREDEGRLSPRLSGHLRYLSSILRERT